MFQNLVVDTPILDFSAVESVKLFEVRPITMAMVSGFVERWHYSRNVNGLRHDFCFGLYFGREMIGAAIFGQPAMPGAAEAYSNGGNLTELRRLCCIDLTPRNTESYFIGKMLRWIKKNTDIDVILSYADTTQGHVGTIYQATYFELVGQSPAVKKIMWNGVLYHDKALRARDDKKRQKPFSVRLESALVTGEATWVDTLPKNIYIMRIKR